MKTNNLLLFFLVLFSQIVVGQIIGDKEIQGKIIVDSIAVDGINIVNISSKKKTVSDENGFFKLMVNEGDILVFSAINLITLHKAINKQDFLKEVVLIKMDIENFALKEVLINEYPRITAENLGIIPFGQKRYTTAERRLKTAGDFKPIMLLGLLGGSMPLDPLINKINGRTKRLKKELIVEGKNVNLKKLDYYFADAYYTDKLKIPFQYVNGFKFYIIENDIFVSKLKNNDESMIKFLVIELGTKYKEIIDRENK